MEHNRNLSNLIQISYAKITLCKLVLNLQPDTIKSLEENMVETLQDIAIGTDFLENTPEAQRNKAKVQK